MISVEELHYFLEYRDGELYWRVPRGSVAKPGDRAGRLQESGYLRVGIKRKEYKAHRIIWALHNGKWPEADIDHIDGNRLNNRIENLRAVSRRENAQNMACHRSGHLPGTCFFKARGVWRAGAFVEGKTLYIGYFETKEQAHAAYLNFLAKAEGRPAQ